ncbi:RHS repeat-associated core domain-containing protein [Streptomyces sp. NPDC048514]|uniref:RHS repeat-associated core domain-containing protein n=1 Tax=Streptomyces sp. NPDC048514 TaxID=3365564 RepID=UPI00372379D2
MRASYRRGFVVAVSSALLSGLVSAPAFAAAVAVAKPKDTTVSVPAGKGMGVPRQQAEPTMTKAPKVTWPKGVTARVDLSQATPGRPKAVTPAGAVLDARAGSAAAKSAVVSVQTPTAAQIGAAGQPPQSAFARGQKAAKDALAEGKGLAVSPSAATPADVDVQVLDRTKIKAIGGVGMALRLTRKDHKPAPGPVGVTLDYSAFKHAYGGDFASRLRLVQMPACALTTPKKRGCSPDTRRYLPVHNDVKSGTLTATVYADADPATTTASATPKFGTAMMAAATTSTVTAVTTSSSSETGDYRASTLSPSGKWDVSTGSGAFTYDLPITVPKAPFGATPNLSLSYNSQSVDGRTSATNNQASWAGIGWDLNVGYIERKYKNCSQDVNNTVGDMCWQSPNHGTEPDGAEYTISLNGVDSALVQDGNGTGSYHVQDDPGWRVQHLTGGHGADDEYWVISSQDGMRYYFGWGRSERDNSITHSVLTVPVAGDDTGEPCHAQFPEPCTQAWRWNLDRVVDPNEVENAYFYDKQTNYYRSVINTDKARQYDAASYLTRIEYGWAAQIPGAKLPAKVELRHVGRCVERMSDADPLGKEPSACPGISSTPGSYPDVPTDLMCDGTSADNYCEGKTYYPTFFTTDMLWDIKTYVSDDGGVTWDPAMQYQMKYGLPDPAGSVGKTLWLDYVQRQGYGDGVDLRLPTINFNGEWLDNQVGKSTLNFRRVTKVYGDLGSVTSVTYGQPDACDINSLPSESSNTQDCFWQKWTPEGASSSTTGWFKKYLVTEVSEDPGVGKGANSDGDPVMTTRYEYHGGAGWRFTNDPLSPDADETWSDWRGYPQVEVFTGTKSNAASTYYWLYRGLDGDRTSKTDSSATRSVEVTDGYGDSWTDSAWLAGRTLESSERDGDGNSHQRVRKEYWVHDTAQYEGLPDARFVRESKTTTDDLVSTGWREHVVKDEYDDTEAASTVYGLPMRTNDWGQVSVDDNRCTTYGRAYNTSAFPDSDVKRWMVFQDEERHYAADCADRTSANQDSYKVTLYDGATTLADNDTKLADGNATEQDVYTDADPADARKTWTDYDGAGRAVATYDGKRRKTTTAYAPNTTWPIDGVTVTTPDPDDNSPAGNGPATPQSTTTWYSRLWGTPYRILDANGHTTRIVLDSVGRISQVFKATEIGNYPSGKPSIQFGYDVPAGPNSDGVPDTVTGPAEVTTGVLQSGSTYVNSYAYLDGLGRTRETQTTAPDGTGRDVVSTRYDTSGNVTGTSAAFYNSGKAGVDGMVLPTVADLPSYTDPVIDWAGRTTETQTLANGVAQASGHTHTYYFGDYTTTVPATGERTDTYTDVFGQTTKTVQHGPIGAITTSYLYTRSGQLKTITDTKGNVTTYGYNWAGDRTSVTDPDAGSSSTAYDENGKVSTSVSNGTTLTYTYDHLQRQKTLSKTTTQGSTLLSRWDYDSATGGVGLPAGSTTYVNGKAYTQAVGSYDARGRAESKTYTVPDDGSGLAGTYKFDYGYDLADHLTSVTYPKVGDLAVGQLPAETVTTTYTDRGLPSKVSSALATYQSNIGFDRQGRINGRTYGTSGGTDATANRAYTYDDTNGSGALFNVKTTVTTGSTTKPAQDDTFTRDLAGQITGVTDAVAKQSECYTYDELNRLTHAWTTEATGGCSGAATPDLSSSLDPYDQAYTYDDLGNLMSVKDTTATGATTRKYAYPGYSADGSTYTAGKAHPHAVTQAGSDSFTYNATGQMDTRTVNGVQSSIAWNAQNRVDSITQHKKDGDEVSTYVYDTDGNVLLRTSAAENVLYLDGQELHKTNGTGEGVKATRLYSAAGTTVAMRQGDGSTNGKLTWLMNDSQASTALLIGIGGAITRRRYTPFGKERNLGSGDLPAGLDRGFLGKPEDDSTSLTILGARMYDPSLGRFISPDELNDQTDPQNLSAYSYADNNPVLYSDPSGLGLACGGNDPACPTHKNDKKKPKSHAPKGSKKVKGLGTVTKKQYQWLTDPDDGLGYKPSYGSWDHFVAQKLDSAKVDLARSFQSCLHKGDSSKNCVPGDDHNAVLRYIHENRDWIETAGDIGQTVNYSATGIAALCVAVTEGACAAGPAEVLAVAGKIGAGVSAVSSVAQAVDSCSYEGWSHACAHDTFGAVTSTMEIALPFVPVGGQKIISGIQDRYLGDGTDLLSRATRWMF